MSRTTAIVLLGVAVCAANALVAAQGSKDRAPVRPATATSSRVASANPVLVGSIKEIMDGIVDPAADVLFDAVSYDVTAAGVVQKVPKTTEDWVEIRRHALLLAEATNLLKMPGRRVAPEKPTLQRENEPPGPEDLKPEEIQALIDVDPAAFRRLAQGLTDAAREALQAADAKDVDRLFASGEAIDKACENCHVKYWYPKDKKPAADALLRRKK
ncbi:MAG: hypothetical protein ABMA15_09025 [Vicinamibacterales bacterium]